MNRQRNYLDSPQGDREYYVVQDEKSGSQVIVSLAENREKDKSYPRPYKQELDPLSKRHLEKHTGPKAVKHISRT